MSYLSEDTELELIRALYVLCGDMHPVYPNTAGRHGGIGGQAMTPGCLWNHAETDEEVAAVDRIYSALSSAIREAERSGAEPDQLTSFRVPHPRS